MPPGRAAAHRARLLIARLGPLVFGGRGVGGRLREAGHVSAKPSSILPDSPSKGRSIFALGTRLLAARRKRSLPPTPGFPNPPDTPRASVSTRFLGSRRVQTRAPQLRCRKLPRRRTGRAADAVGIRAIERDSATDNCLPPAALRPERAASADLEGEILSPQQPASSRVVLDDRGGELRARAKSSTRVSRARKVSAERVCGNRASSRHLRVRSRVE
ncbi:hypothetical protein MRX96_039760 [Rhipicephalus microplus]